MIKIIDGDLLASTTDIIAHQVNCKGAFNSGVARAIREYDVQVFHDYRAYCSSKTADDLIGDVRYFQSDMDDKIYANLFAQKSYGYDGKQYTDFRGKYYFLSNFYAAPVVWDGVSYKNNEAAFQSAKVGREYRQEFAELTASEAKKLGRKVPLRPDWENVKERIMYEICLAKFSQNEELKEKLLLTGECALEEGNTWGDKVWGTVNGEGENKLGKILMKIREELRHE